jgi:hypothetical protein
VSEAGKMLNGGRREKVTERAERERKNTGRLSVAILKVLAYQTQMDGIS